MAISEDDKLEGYKVWATEKRLQISKLNQDIQAQVNDFNLRTQISLLNQQIEKLSKLAQTPEVIKNDKLTKDITDNITGFKKTLDELTKFETTSKIMISPEINKLNSRINIRIPNAEFEIEGKEIPLTYSQRFANFFISIGRRVFGSKTALYTNGIEKDYNAVQIPIDKQLKDAQSELNAFTALKLRTLTAGSQLKSLVESLRNKQPIIESRDGNLELDGNNKDKEAELAQKTQGAVSNTKLEDVNNTILEIFRMKELFSASMNMPGSEDIKKWADKNPSYISAVTHFSEGLRNLLNVVDLVEPINPVPSKFLDYRTEQVIPHDMSDEEKSRLEEFNENVRAYNEKIKQDWGKYDEEVKAYDEKMKLKDTYQEAVVSLLLNNKGLKLASFLGDNPDIADYLSQNLSSLKTAADSFAKFSEAERNERDYASKNPHRKEKQETGKLEREYNEAQKANAQMKLQEARGNLKGDYAKGIYATRVNAIVEPTARTTPSVASAPSVEAVESSSVPPTPATPESPKVPVAPTPPEVPPTPVTPPESPAPATPDTPVASAPSASDAPDAPNAPEWPTVTIQAKTTLSDSDALEASPELAAPAAPTAPSAPSAPEVSSDTPKRKWAAVKGVTEIDNSSDEARKIVKDKLQEEANRKKDPILVQALHLRNKQIQGKHELKDASENPIPTSPIKRKVLPRRPGSPKP